MAKKTTPSFSESPMTGSLDWMGQMAQISSSPLKVQETLVKEALKILARNSQEYSEYLEKLAAADSPMTSLAHHNEYLRKVIASGVEDTTTLLEALRNQNVDPEADT